MSGSEEDRTITDWRSESRFYRRKPGAGWLLGLLAVPLLLALIGWGGGIGASDRENTLTLPSVDPSASLTATAAAPTPGAPTPGAPTAEAPDGDFPPFSIVRNGNGYTLTGQLPDEETKRGLLDSLKLVLPGATIVDELTVTPGVKTPDIAGLGGLFSAAVAMPDFALKLDGGTVTLTGTAPAEPVKASAEEYVKAAWPNVNVVNDIQVKAPTPTGAPPAPSAPSAPSSTAAAPPPTAPPAPQAPGSGGPCANLQSDITGLLRTPINFITDGFVLAPQSEQLIRQIADKVKACPNVRIAVVGHTDNTGNDAINIPLSGSRAKAVAEELVSDGVPANTVSSRGVGAANPVATNATPEGRAQNRRVEITVS